MKPAKRIVLLSCSLGALGDMVAAGLFVTPERARQVRYSAPTVKVRAGLLVRHGNPAGLHSYRQVAERGGLRVAVLNGSVEHDRLRALGSPPDAALRVPDAQAGWVGGPAHQATVRPFGFLAPDLASGLTPAAMLAR